MNIEKEFENIRFILCDSYIDENGHLIELYRHLVTHTIFNSKNEKYWADEQKYLSTLEFDEFRHYDKDVEHLIELKLDVTDKSILSSRHSKFEKYFVNEAVTNMQKHKNYEQLTWKPYILPKEINKVIEDRFKLEI